MVSTKTLHDIGCFPPINYIGAVNSLIFDMLPAHEPKKKKKHYGETRRKMTDTQSISKENLPQGEYGFKKKSKNKEKNIGKYTLGREMETGQLALILYNRSQHPS